MSTVSGRATRLNFEKKKRKVFLTFALTARGPERESVERGEIPSIRFVVHRVEGPLDTARAAQREHTSRGCMPRAHSDKVAALGAVHRYCAVDALAHSISSLAVAGALLWRK